MELHPCDIWEKYGEGHYICVTTNGFIKKNGECVMGRGCAKQCATRYPWFPLALGSHIRDTGNVVGVFGRIITFPTKHNWFWDSDLELIKESAIQLLRLSSYVGSEIYLPAPGCGNGKLSWSDVSEALYSVSGFQESKIVITVNSGNEHKEETRNDNT